MVRRMLLPEAMSAVSLSRLSKVSQPTLSRWLRDSVTTVSPSHLPLRQLIEMSKGGAPRAMMKAKR